MAEAAVQLAAWWLYEQLRFTVIVISQAVIVISQAVIVISQAVIVVVSGCAGVIVIVTRGRVEAIAVMVYAIACYFFPAPRVHRFIVVIAVEAGITVAGFTSEKDLIGGTAEGLIETVARQVCRRNRRALFISPAIRVPIKQAET